MRKANSIQAAAALGNIVDHYDTALFSLLAPFIAPLFFANQTPIVALILTYAMLCLGILTRPIGALFFGKIGDTYGRKTALFFSLSGMGLTTFLIGCLPTHYQVGSLAPFLLAIVRSFQGFFATGESIGGAIFMLESAHKNRRNLLSSFYDASTILGILFASFVVMLLSSSETVLIYWRVLFWLGSLTAIIGIFIRSRGEESPEFVNDVKTEYKNLFFLIYKYRRPFLLLVLAAGFSYSTYSFSFTLMNGFVPLISDVSKTSLLQMNTSLLVFDMLLLPCFGLLTRWVKREKLMLFGLGGVTLSSMPLFYLLGLNSFLCVAIVRSCIVFFGVAFAATYYAWALELVPVKARFTLLSIGSALGSQLIGNSSVAVSLWLYKATKWIAAPGLYLSFIALTTLFAVTRYSGQQVPLPSQD